jgi:hypothetical protein
MYACMCVCIYIYIYICNKGLQFIQEQEYHQCAAVIVGKQSTDSIASSFECHAVCPRKLIGGFLCICHNAHTNTCVMFLYLMSVHLIINYIYLSVYSSVHGCIPELWKLGDLRWHILSVSACNLLTTAAGTIHISALRTLTLSLTD